MVKKPNIVFILSDQQRWDTLGCYGQKLDVTPNLDRMAERGVLFRNAFTCQPVCGPARSCIQTGKYATQTACFRNDIALPQDEKTIAHWLSEAGYEVGYIGKWHLASTGGLADIDIGEHFNYQAEPIPLELRGGWKDYWLASDVLEITSHGYDGHMFNSNMEKVNFKGYRADCITDFALDYLKTRELKKPFFLFLSYIEPHHQNDRNRFEGPEGSKIRFKDYSIPGDLQETDGDWREGLPDYLGCCSSLDYNLSRIFDQLENLKLIENTLVIYTSDHGCHFRTRNRDAVCGYDDYKRSCHEASIRIPMIIEGPGFRGGRVIEELVSLIDIPPTLLDFAGINYPAYMQGKSMIGLADGKTKDWQEEVFIQISESQVGRAVRTNRWKYSVTAPNKDGRYYSGSDLYVEEFLYDLINDPYERNNLIDNADYIVVKKELRETLKNKMRKAGEKEPYISVR